MPAFLTHKHAGDDIRSRITRPDILKLIQDHEDAYYSGTQGGDYFYSYKYYSMWAGYRYKLYGWALHRSRIQRFFSEAAQYTKNEDPSDITKAFLVGYITHYALDMHVHPLIQKLGPAPLTSHNVVECALDCMYSLRHDTDPWAYDRAKLVRDTHVPTDEIDTFFSTMMDRVYTGFELPPAPYHTTYGYFEKMHGMLQATDRSSVMRRDLADMFTICKTRYLVYKPYDEIRDLVDYEPLFARLEQAIEHAVRLIDVMAGYWYDNRDITVVEEAFYNVNMHGMPITPVEERRAFREKYKKAPTRW